MKRLIGRVTSTKNEYCPGTRAELGTLVKSIEFTGAITLAIHGTIPAGGIPAAASFRNCCSEIG
ncbi:MAG TPA: hypothetical protein VLD55_09130 [Candidatus Sulfobium mesophilum]|nr:hypothetical protein [Candidatus Sulfobium mesophilum]